MLSEVLGGPLEGERVLLPVGEAAVFWIEQGALHRGVVGEEDEVVVRGTGPLEGEPELCQVIDDRSERGDDAVGRGAHAPDEDDLAVLERRRPGCPRSGFGSVGAAVRAAGRSRLLAVAGGEGCGEQREDGKSDAHRRRPPAGGFDRGMVAALRVSAAAASRVGPQAKLAHGRPPGQCPGDRLDERIAGRG